MKQNTRPATAAEITEIVGPLDDAGLVRIVETEATPAEVLEAFTWATADDQIGTELEPRPRGVVARVYEILKHEEPQPGRAQVSFVRAVDDFWTPLLHVRFEGELAPP
jgi:hypothetical protein